MRITNVKLNYPNTSLDCANSIWLYVRWQCKNVRWNPDLGAEEKCHFLVEKERRVDGWYVLGVVLWLFYNIAFFRPHSFQLDASRFKMAYPPLSLKSITTATCATIVFHIFIFHHILCIIYYSIKRIKWSHLPYPTNPNPMPSTQYTDNWYCCTTPSLSTWNRTASSH